GGRNEGYMSRAAIKINVLAVVVTVFTAVGVTWATVANSPSHKVTLTSNAQHQVVQISYHGQDGSNALQLLKKHADVQTRQYSFSDMVVSIDGTKGNGPK